MLSYVQAGCCDVNGARRLTCGGEGGGVAPSGQVRAGEGQVTS